MYFTARVCFEKLNINGSWAQTVSMSDIIRKEMIKVEGIKGRTMTQWINLDQITSLCYEWQVPYWC